MKYFINSLCFWVLVQGNVITISQYVDYFLLYYIFIYYFYHFIENINYIDGRFVYFVKRGITNSTTIILILT